MLFKGLIVHLIWHIIPQPSRTYSPLATVRTQSFRTLSDITSCHDIPTAVSLRLLSNEDDAPAVCLPAISASRQRHRVRGNFFSNIPVPQRHISQTKQITCISNLCQRVNKEVTTGSVEEIRSQLILMMVVTSLGEAGIVKHPTTATRSRLMPVYGAKQSTQVIPKGTQFITIMHIGSGRHALHTSRSQYFLRETSKVLPRGFTVLVSSSMIHYRSLPRGPEESLPGS